MATTWGVTLEAWHAQHDSWATGLQQLKTPEIFEAAARKKEAEAAARKKEAEAAARKREAEASSVLKDKVRAVAHKRAMDAESLALVYLLSEWLRAASEVRRRRSMQDKVNAIASRWIADYEHSVLSHGFAGWTLGLVLIKKEEEEQLLSTFVGSALEGRAAGDLLIQQHLRERQSLGTEGEASALAAWVALQSGVAEFQAARSQLHERLDSWSREGLEAQATGSALVSPVLGQSLADMCSTLAILDRSSESTEAMSSSSKESNSRQATEAEPQGAGPLPPEGAAPLRADPLPPAPEAAERPAEEPPPVVPPSLPPVPAAPLPPPVPAASLPPPSEESCEVSEGPRQIRVQLGSVTGVRSQAMLSFKVGEVRKQELVEALAQRPLHFPAVFGEGRPPMLGVTVLHELASASFVLHPCQGEYPLRLRRGGPEAREAREAAEAAEAVELQLSVRGRPASSPQLVSDLRCDMTCREVRSFLEREESLVHYVWALLHAAIEERVEDPYSFMAACVVDLLGGGTPPAGAAGLARAWVPAVGSTLPVGMELAVRVAAGAVPDGSVLLAVLAGESRQVKLSPGGEVKLSFSSAALGPLRMSILSPEVSRKVPLDFDREAYSFSLTDKDGRPITLDLSAQLLPPGAACAGLDSTPAERGELEDGEAYLKRHGLLEFGPGLFKGLVTDMPQDPYKFILQYVDKFRAGLAAAAT